MTPRELVATVVALIVGGWVLVEMANCTAYTQPAIASENCIEKVMLRAEGPEETEYLIRACMCGIKKVKE